MSRTADLEHLFQLEQVLSLRPSIPEWSSESCNDPPESLIDSDGTCTTKHKLSNSTLIEQNHNFTTTSFDPGGDTNKLNEKNLSDKDASHDLLKDSKVGHNESPKAIFDDKKEILSYAASSCGRCIAFIALTENESTLIPQLGSVMLKPALKCSSSPYYSESDKHQVNNEDLVAETGNDHLKIGVSVHYLQWYDHGDSSADVMTCVTLCEEKEICLVSCKDGSLFLLPLHVIFPGFCFNEEETEDTHKNGNAYFHVPSSDVALEIFAIPRPMNHQRSNPTALIIWNTDELTAAIVGTLHGKVIAVDPHNGKEVSQVVVLEL